MSLYAANSRISVIAAVCILLLTAGPALAVPDDDPNGPTVTLSYGAKAPEKNAFASFMYFVPLVSPTLVNVETSADNGQKVGVVSYERKITSRSFCVKYEFEMTGEGFHKYVFDAEEVIAAHITEAKKGQTLEHLIDYIKFDGPGIGRIEVRGTIADSTRTVSEVVQYFNAKGRKSPLTIGLYDVKPKDGLYKYENRSNELVARVDAFKFKKSKDEPRMGITLASVDAAARPNGLLAGVKGAIANLFIKPPVVSRLGNDTMLDFGLALLNEQPSFTFPKAKNIKESRTVPVTSNQ